MKIPAASSSVRRFSSNTPPNQAAPAPKATNIAAKPSTNSAVALVTRRGCAPSSSKPTPDTNDR
jgi:hypothetical protein